MIQPENIWTRIDTSKLYPPFLKKIQKMVADLESDGFRFYAISGMRTFEEQTALYAQGRTKPGKIVTNAKAGFSNHNFGIAVDFCRDKEVDRAGLQPDWDYAAYEVLAQYAEKHGLEAAYRWKSFPEGPHIQLPLASKGITIGELRSIRNAGGDKAVFARLDKVKW